jgi:RNA polymerase sigma-70 factor (ECF subfamily)
MATSSFRIDLDEMTLARARKGNRRACEQIYRLFQRPAYTLAYRICQCPDMAQDVVQDAFIVLFRKLDQFRGEAPFWGWLRRIIANHAISALRRKPREVSLDLVAEQGTTADSHFRIQSTLDANRILATLPDADRTVVWLHDVEGYNHREIAEMMDKSESYSKTRLSRARQRMRDWLDAGTESVTNDNTKDGATQPLAVNRI